MESMYPSDEEELQDYVKSAPFDDKVDLTFRKIEQWIDHWNGNVYVAWSGGMDSTVLLDLVRQVDPNVPAVFCDTGQEYPEIRDFVRTGTNVVWIRPERNFRSVLFEEGLPLVSKRVSKRIRILKEMKPGTENTIHLYLTGTNTSGEYDRNAKLSAKWRHLIDADIKVSEKCCDELKKKPFQKYKKETGRMPFWGLRIDEGGERRILIHKPCNIFSKRWGRSTPIQFWSDGDIWQYVRGRNLPYCKLYDQGETRTGCMFCAFGAHLEQERGENRFERMKRSHPRQWDYYMHNIGMADQLKLVGVRIGDEG
ncbi:MAG: phosphoadenosine phosphosulfate reductase family protein [Magnetococcus sp. THC-1_WYH]